MKLEENRAKSAGGPKESDASHRLKFECSQCGQKLSVAPTAAGLTVQCPSCNTRLKAPQLRKNERQAWEEKDPTNPRFLTGLGLGAALATVWYALLFPFIPPADKAVADYSGMQFLASLFYKHFLVSFINTLFFTWGMAILGLKQGLMRHQQAAMNLDVLPSHLGREIEAGNVSQFIDHVYALPAKLRDSLMVNRVRKALELFEIRQSPGDVREMLLTQSDIDSARIGGSYTLPRAFLWAIPLLGFIGTVVGLSHAIGGMNFANVEDVGKIVAAINNVTSGLGTAFDATLLGLVLALILNFPLNALAKKEDDTLHTIDSFCTEVLLPRLKEPAPSSSGAVDASGVSDSALRSLSQAQDRFVSELSRLTQQMGAHAAGIEQRMSVFQQTLVSEFSQGLAALRTQNQASIQAAMDQVTGFQRTLATASLAGNENLRAQARTAITDALTQVTQRLEAMSSASAARDEQLRASAEATLLQATQQLGRHLSSLEGLSAAATARDEQLRAGAEAMVRETSQQVAKHLGGLESGIAGLNRVLEDLGAKQVVIQAPPRKRGWFGLS